MESIINFLIENYVYVIFVVILLILALIGYIVENSRMRKIEALENAEKPLKEIPNTSIDTDIKLGEMGNSGETSVNSVDEVLKL